MNDGKYKVGDFVRIISVPDLQDEKTPKETIDIFKENVGKTFKIEGFNDFGLIEIRVDDSNFIWIETEFVEKIDGAV